MSTIDTSDLGRRTREDWILAARKLAERAASRVERAESLRRLPDETVADIVDGGFARMMNPRQHGGFEIDFETLVDVDLEIGRHCAATAWCTSLLASHGWMIGAYPAEVQSEVWSKNPSALVATQINPIGKMRRTDEGWLLSGVWPLASAIDHSDWVALGAVDVAAPPGPPDCLVCLLPKSEVSVKDTWFSVGLKGSGSNTVTVENLFVPAHRVIRDRDLHEGTAPGGAIPGASPLYRVPKLSGFVSSLIGPILGTANGCVEGCIERLRTRPPLPQGVTGTQLAIAESSAEVEAAILLVKQTSRDALAKATRGEPFVLEERLRARRNAAFASLLCNRATNRAIDASGTGVLLETSPVQRGWRDLRVMCGHFALAFHAAGELWGAEVTRRPGPPAAH